MAARSLPIPIPGRSSPEAAAGGLEARAPTPPRRPSGGRAPARGPPLSGPPSPAPRSQDLLGHPVGSPLAAASLESAAAELEAACRARGARCEVALVEHLGDVDPAGGRRLSAHLRETLAGLTPAQVRLLAARVRQGGGGGQ